MPSDSYHKPTRATREKISDKAQNLDSFKLYSSEGNKIGEYKGQDKGDKYIIDNMETVNYKKTLILLPMDTIGWWLDESKSFRLLEYTDLETQYPFNTAQKATFITYKYHIKF
jgi:hypothetical protein